MQPPAHEHRRAAAQQDAQRPADQAQHDRLDEELAQDVVAAGADGHAQADLAGPLGDGDEHDVHDAHPADHQRDHGHGQQQDAHQLRGRAQRLGDFAHVADVEIVGLVLLDAVPLVQQGGDLLDGLRNLLGGGRLDA